MLVTTYDLDGRPGPMRDLRRSDPATLVLDTSPVLAVSHWGSYMALTLPERLVLVRMRDYERFIGYPCTLLHRRR
ncbi:MAG: hypothetical protein RLZZ387_62 [Chloroflexota bacterium]|jgi:hypothetical protein